ncbi:MAG: redox-regulated ATPase YchF [Candidatus Riflebacteria bacterium]|nr:redox-regulated ATPase YchF [Candidatus Riflebacteria bacterium]
MNIGLAGLPMSGKTTVFNMATRATAQVRDYIAQSDEINNGQIKVPDERIDKLTAIYKPKSTVYATVEFTDIPGVAKAQDGSSGASFAGKTLANIRICDALGLVIRVFGGETVPHVHDRVDPAADIEELSLEFVCADLALVQNKIERVNKEMKAGKKPELLKELELMEKLKTTLEAEKFISSLTLTSEEEALTRGFRFLTQKPMLAIGNCSDDQLKNSEDPFVKKFLTAAAARKWTTLLIAAKTEMEIASLSPEEESAFLQEYGISESSRSRLLHEAYRVLNYISFFTVGEDEVRAWPIQRGFNAQKAAGRIHSDIERGFIRAEVIAYEPFMTHNGNKAACKSAGQMRLEGKEYLVADGDIIEFRFNV